jgi:hypothetical protein
MARGPVCAAALLGLALVASAASHIKVLKVAVTNPSASMRAAQNVVLPVPALKAIAKDFAAGAVIVTTSDAATLAQDAAIFQTIELPSQADDLDGDGKWDELVFRSI